VHPRGCCCQTLEGSCHGYRLHHCQEKRNEDGDDDELMLSRRDIEQDPERHYEQRETRYTDERIDERVNTFIPIIVSGAKCVGT